MSNRYHSNSLKIKIFALHNYMDWAMISTIINLIFYYVTINNY